MKTKILIASMLFSLFIIGPIAWAKNSTVADDNLSEAQIQMHLNSLDYRLNEKKENVVKAWPDRFQSISIKGKTKIDKKEQHLQMLKTIPKKFYTGYKIGKTKRTKKWFITSIDPDSNTEESLWILVIATKIGDDKIYANSIW